MQTWLLRVVISVFVERSFVFGERLSRKSTPAWLGFSEALSSNCLKNPAGRTQWNEYEDFHRECRTKPECWKRALVWQCDGEDHCLGLGDQLRGLASALYAAMATKRVFFVKWARNTQSLLKLFESSTIDVTVPEDFHIKDICKSSGFMRSSGDWKGKFIPACNHLASADGSCEIWRTNVKPWAWLPDANFKACSPAGFDEIERLYTVGCAVDFMFQLPELTAADRSVLSGLLGTYARRLDHFCRQG